MGIAKGKSQSTSWRGLRLRINPLGRLQNWLKWTLASIYWALASRSCPHHQMPKSIWMTIWKLEDSTSQTPSPNKIQTWSTTPFRPSVWKNAGVWNSKRLQRMLKMNNRRNSKMKGSPDAKSLFRRREFLEGSPEAPIITILKKLWICIEAILYIKLYIINVFLYFMIISN